MKVILVTPNYPREIGGAAHLFHELALSLECLGHDVTVLTGYPRYNVKEVPPQYRRGLWMNEGVDKISVKRIRIPSLPRTNKIARGGRAPSLWIVVERVNFLGSWSRGRDGLLPAVADAVDGLPNRQDATNARGGQHPGPIPARSSRVGYVDQPVADPHV